jgi:hypothetical protein
MLAQYTPDLHVRATLLQPEELSSVMDSLHVADTQAAVGLSFGLARTMRLKLANSHIATGTGCCHEGLRGGRHRSESEPG